jgi:LuxR family maltose regulon positive regulatory protein
VLDPSRDFARKPILISAPTVYSKTTLLSEWVAGCDKVGWLSLDEHDNDPARFWTYVCAAICRTLPNVGETTRATRIQA